MTKTPNNLEKRQFPRIKLTHSEPLYLFIPEQQHPLIIENISHSGLGIKRSSFAKTPTLRSNLKGQLVFQEKTLTLQTKIVRIGQELIGVSFSDSSEELAVLLKALLANERNYLKIIQLNSNIKDFFDQEEAWWIQKEKNELLLLMKDGHLSRFYILLNDIYLEGKSYGDLKFVVLPENTKEIINLTTPIPHEHLAQARTFLESIAELPNTIARIIHETLDNDELTIPG